MYEENWEMPENISMFTGIEEEDEFDSNLNYEPEQKEKVVIQIPEEEVEVVEVIENEIKEVKKWGKRYIPLDNLKKKKMSYLVYGYLQFNSYRNPDGRNRYIYKDSVKNNAIAKETGLGVNTVPKKIKELIDDGLIVLKTLDNGDEIYYLPTEVSKKYLLLDLDYQELRGLLTCVRENVLRFYLFLKDRSEYLRKQGKKNNLMEIEQGFICEQIGLSKSSRKLISEYADCLKRYGLIDYKMVTFKNNGIIMKGSVLNEG